jgi:hypothetical protein
MSAICLTRETGVLQQTGSMQLRMFVSNDPKEAEKNISQWLSQNDVHVRHITQSQSEKGGHFVLIVSLYYEPNS